MHENSPLVYAILRTLSVFLADQHEATVILVDSRETPLLFQHLTPWLSFHHTIIIKWNAVAANPCNGVFY